jgi:glycosyltransferase involved in cell wall biosynthesis
MNVLMMVSWYAPKGKIGEGNFHYEQAKDLNRFCNCAIYYPYDRFITKGYEVGKENGIMVFRSKYALKNKIRNRIYMFQAMRRIVKNFQPDIIHGNVATESGRFAVILGKIFHIPVVITEHSTIEASNVEHFPHYYYAKNVYGNSRYNACVSDVLTERLSKIFPQYSFHTIYNGIRELEPRQNQHLYCKSNRINIGMVAGFYSKEIKGVQYVFPAVKKMLDEGYAVYLHIIGGGIYLDEFVLEADRMGLSQHCTFYGECTSEKVFEIEAEMDFVVSASLFESFGCAVAEAAMLGKPVVATKSGGVESIVNTDNGILVEKGNTDSLYSGLIWMCEHYKQYDSWKISEDARKRFSIDMISRKYMDVYQDVLMKKDRKS